MKNTSFFLLLLLITNMLLAQETYHSFIGDATKEWITYEGSAWTGTKYVKYFFDGDTLIENQQYHNFYTESLSMDEQNTKLLIAGIREDNKKVYAKFTTESLGELPEFLIYDFSIEEGDTLVIPFLLTYDMDSLTLAVTQKELTEIGGIKKNKWSLEFLTNHSYSREETWLEGIGSLQGPLHTGSQFASETYATLAAVYEQNRPIYCNTELSPNIYCSINEEGALTTNIVEPNSSNNSLQIIPNIISQQPVTIKFSLPQSSLTSLHIYNSSGQKIYTSISNTFLSSGKHQQELQLDGVPTGIYYAVLSLHGTTVTIQKMLSIK